MTNDVMIGGVYLLMAAMLVLGALMTRREPAARLLTMALAWIAIFGAGFILFTFRDNPGWVAQRLKAEAVGTPVSEGSEMRIPMAIDGHFWVDAAVTSNSWSTAVLRRPPWGARPLFVPELRYRSGAIDMSAQGTASSGSRAVAPTS